MESNAKRLAEAAAAAKQDAPTAEPKVSAEEAEALLN